MYGLMQQRELLISGLIEFAQKNHADTEIISRRVEGDIHRSNWAEVGKRSQQIAHALKRMDLAAPATAAKRRRAGRRRIRRRGKLGRGRTE